jgi:hypothetical protein
MFYNLLCFFLSKRHPGPFRANSGMADSKNTGAFHSKELVSMLNKGGAPLGNQNARKHGYYSDILDHDQKRNLRYAQLVKGLDQEISMVRVKIKSLLQHAPNDIQLLAIATGALARLYGTRERYAAKLSRVDEVKEAVKAVQIEIGGPLGLFGHQTASPTSSSPDPPGSSKLDH